MDPFRREPGMSAESSPVHQQSSPRSPRLRVLDEYDFPFLGMPFGQGRQQSPVGRQSPVGQGGRQSPVGRQSAVQLKRSAVRRPARVNRPVELVPCDVCGKLVGIKAHRRHIIKEHPDMSICPQCGHKSASIFAREKHAYREHGTLSHKCQICNSPFIHKSGLIQHMRQSH